MRFYILTFSLIIVLLSVTLETSCSNVNQDSNQERIEELEKQVAALSKQLEQQKSNQPLPPQVFEKIIPTVRTSFYSSSADNQTLKFLAETGDIINGEVTTFGGTSNDFICTVRDPNNNVLQQSSTITKYFTVNSYVQGKYTESRLESAQKYPWKFSFIASMNGEYSLKIYRDISSDDTTGARLKITVNRPR